MLCIPDEDQPDDDPGRRPGVGPEVFAAGDELDGVVPAALVDTDCANNKIYDGGERDDVDPFIQSVDRGGVDEVGYGLIDNDERGHEDERAFDGGGEEFGFAVAVGVILVAGFGGDMEAKEADDAGDDVDDAFEGVGEHGDGLGEVVGGEFQHEEEDGDDRYPALDADIFGAFCHQCVFSWSGQSGGGKSRDFGVNRKAGRC